MLIDYFAVLLFLLLGAMFVPLNLLLGSLIRPKIDEPDKYTAYECGEESEGHLFNQFNPRFYIIALIFIIFEVELVFLFPWGMLFRRLGWFGFVEMLIFLAILMVGLVYAWGKGDLEWVKSTGPRDAESGSRAPESEMVGR